METRAARVAAARLRTEDLRVPALFPYAVPELRTLTLMYEIAL
jgi:hypothetical protein